MDIVIQLGSKQKILKKILNTKHMKDGKENRVA